MLHHPDPKTIVRRKFSSESNLASLPPLLQRIYKARNIDSTEALERSLAKLPSPWLLTGMEVMVDCLMQAIDQKQHVLIVADFDADGATSCALALSGLKMLGVNQVSYIVPNRFEFGYGLTPEIVEVASLQKPDILLTVDNGISSIEGVLAAKALGLRVLITDHHLPGAQLPEADAIVNPNLAGDRFPSKSLAGVGVMFYVLMALRARLREAGSFAGKAEPNLAQLLDLVALGTIADVVSLDSVNRILVYQGLQRIRSNQARPGIIALIEVAGRNPKTITASDLGFAVAPRLNAAGRLEDMSQGIVCLLCDAIGPAKVMAEQLDQLNRERREIEDQMKYDAFAIIDQMRLDQEVNGLCLFDANWHQGVIGIVASRVKDKLHRPVIAFAPSANGEIKGSARSIPGVHIKDVLNDIAINHPEMLKKFGGHAMAAGLSLDEADFKAFARLFDEQVQTHLNDMDLALVVQSDGELDAEEMRIESAEMLQQAGPFGQGFPEPLFDGEFEVVQSRIVGSKHLKLSLRTPDKARVIDAIAFFVEDPESWLGCRRLKACYQLDINEFKGNRSLQLRIEYMEAG